MTISIEALAAPVASIVVSTIVAWIALNTRLAVLETKLDELGEDVRKHNNVVERVTKLEMSDKSLWSGLDTGREAGTELQHQVRDLERWVAAHQDV